MSKKPIIVFEGIEGSGKTFHLNNIARYLKKKRISFIKIREPGGNYNSEKIRKLILNKNSNFNPTTDLLLYLAARNENINIIIKKYFKKKVILIDRFVDSTIAYQHYGMGVNLNLIKNINKVILKGIKVDFTFLHYVSNKNMKKRLLKRKNLNRYDRFNMKFYQKVQSGYFKISKQKKTKYFLVNSNLSIVENKKNIIKKINKLI
tara:strand:+ start:798 stop:1412 length:615 start_codon:yes stop_codon:yes gene_type:complete